MFDNHLIFIFNICCTLFKPDWSNLPDSFVDVFSRKKERGKKKTQKRQNANMLHQQIVLFRTQNKLCDSGMLWR